MTACVTCSPYHRLRGGGTLAEQTCLYPAALSTAHCGIFFLNAAELIERRKQDNDDDDDDEDDDDDDEEESPHAVYQGLPRVGVLHLYLPSIE